MPTMTNLVVYKVGATELENEAVVTFMNVPPEVSGYFRTANTEPELMDGFDYYIEEVEHDSNESVV